MDLRSKRLDAGHLFAPLGQLRRHRERLVSEVRADDVSEHYREGGQLAQDGVLQTLLLDVLAVRCGNNVVMKMGVNTRM